MKSYVLDATAQARRGNMRERKHVGRIRSPLGDIEIGASLQAAVTVTAEGEPYDALSSLGDDLKFVFIASAATLKKGAFAVEVAPASGKKCERCWHVREDVGANAEHPDLCGRCVSNLHGEGEARRHA